MSQLSSTHLDLTAGTVPGDFRQVLAVVDLDGPVEPVLRSAVASSIAHAVPLKVVVLHQRPGFTTDPALAARMARRLHQAQRRMATAVSDAARTGGLQTFSVRHVPVRRVPLMSRLARMESTVADELRRQPPSLLVIAPHLRRPAGPTTGEPGQDQAGSVRSARFG